MTSSEILMSPFDVVAARPAWGSVDFQSNGGSQIEANLRTSRLEQLMGWWPSVGPSAVATIGTRDMDLSDELPDEEPDASLRLRVIELLCSAHNVTPDRLIQTADAVARYVVSGAVPGRPIADDGMDAANG